MLCLYTISQCRRNPFLVDALHCTYSKVVLHINANCVLKVAKRCTIYFAAMCKVLQNSWAAQRTEVINVLFAIISTVVVHYWI